MARFDADDGNSFSPPGSVKPYLNNVAVTVTGRGAARTVHFDDGDPRQRRRVAVRDRNRRVYGGPSGSGTRRRSAGSYFLEEPLLGPEAPF